MAATKIGDIRAKSADELSTMLLDLRKEQFNLRMQRGTGEFKQTHQFGKLRREIARVKTVLGEKK